MMSRVRVKVTWLAGLAMLLVATVAWCESPTLPVRAHQAASQLINPAAPTQPKRLKLPPGKPTIELATFWMTDRSPAVLPAPPEPAPLELPAWLLPEVGALDQVEPREPPGEAAIVSDVDDSEPMALPEQVIQLAMSRVEMAPSRSSALLVVAREMALDADTAGDFGDVIDQCHRALDAGPDEQAAVSLAKLGAWAYNRRGELLVERGDEHAAFEDFQEAVLLDQDCWAALHNRGVTLARYDQQAEALADFNRVIDLAPDFAVARYNRGEVLSQMQQWQAAADDYTAALRAMPEEAALYVARGHARYQLGQTTEAVSNFNTAIRLDPTLSEAYVGRGNLYAGQALYEQAAADFEQALRLNPRSPAAYQSAAWLLATCPLPAHRDGAKAVESAHRLQQLTSEESPMVLDTLAVAYAAAGKFPQAIIYQQQAIVQATDPSDKNEYLERLALYRKGRAYQTK